VKPLLGFGLLAALCVVLGLARSDFSPTARKKIELSFWNGWTGPDGRAMLEVIRQFSRENPDVSVSMQRMDWATYYNKLMVGEVDGRGPEIFVIHASTLPRMVRAGFIDDLSDLFQSIPQNDFDPYVLKQLKFGSILAGLPLDIHPQGLYCNVDFLKEIGMDQPPRNREEFLRAARAMKTSDRWGFALANWQENFQSLFPQFGGRYLDENGRADLANPGNVRALEFMTSLVKEKLVPPPENGLGWVGFRQKKVGMVWAGVFMLGDLLRLDDFHYVGAPMPVIGDHPGTMADSHVLCVQKGLRPERREAALRFIRYLSAHSIAWAAAGQVPARRSVRATPEFGKMQVQSAFATQIPTMMYPPRTTVLFETSLEIGLAVEKAMRGRATPAEALRVANENAQRFLDRDRAERTP
jgi:multiple sugar transport system substrate-binding protein